MLHKTFDLLETKVDGDAGTFEATVAVFNNVDRGGDRIMPGAFKDTLAQWAASGDPIPVILSHQWDNPMAHIGVVEQAKETGLGLFVKGKLDVTDNEIARQVHRLMLRRSLKEFSFGYDVPKGGSKRAKDGANELLQLDLAEVGPTLKGMNPATELHAVKSALDGEKPDTELQEVNSRLETLERAVEDLSKKADATDQEPSEQARRVDPLRNHALDLAQEIRQGGVSTQTAPSKPEKQVAPTPEMDAASLRRHSRELMLEILRGVPSE